MASWPILLMPQNQPPSVRTVLRTAGTALVGAGTAGIIAGEYVLGIVSMMCGLGLFYVKDYLED